MGTRIRRGAIALVTRPGDAGQRLAGALRDHGQNALWWPAFDLLAPADVEPLQAVLQQLAQFDLAVLVSPAAVRGLVALDLCGTWPVTTRIAAVGSGTLQLARSLLPGAQAARGIAPAADAPQGGSEALWEALRREREPPRRALIVRAEAGREWLGDRLREAGCRVEYAGVYRRSVHVPSREQRAALSASHGGGDRAAAIVTSSEAVAALDRQFSETPEAKAWLRQGLALCSHPRIANALRTAGYAMVLECELSASGVLEAMDGAGAGAGGPGCSGARDR
jgi:uroporphyrinogen III methyltransferase / synthase